jgi:RNase P subunit RPR2
VSGEELVLLPDVDPERYAHGIVAVDPQTVVQCDGCGYTHTHPRPALAILLSGIEFNHLTRDPRRRLCRECRRKAGWPTT